MPDIYLDHAATTPLDPRVLEVMLPYLKDKYGNPSSFHSRGKVATDALREARTSMANILHVRPDEILFTSGGTESDNLAILGYARMNKQFGTHIITTSFEHHAVLEACIRLEKKEGFRVTYLKPNKEGMIDPKQIEEALTEDTILVSVMYANNEVGTIQPIAEMGTIIQKYREEKKLPHLVFHTDACQAAAYLDMNVEKLHVDMLTMNSPKIYGPKGTGLLYVKRGIKLEPLMFGGAQERGIRPGTEDVAGIIGFAKALSLAVEHRKYESERLAQLRDGLQKRLTESFPKAVFSGHPRHRLSGHLHVSFPGLDGERLVFTLENRGVLVATGSACAANKGTRSHVLTAMGLSPELADGSLRLTLGHLSTEENTTKAADIIIEEVTREYARVQS